VSSTPRTIHPSAQQIFVLPLRNTSGIASSMKRIVKRPRSEPLLPRRQKTMESSLLKLNPSRRHARLEMRPLNRLLETLKLRGVKVFVAIIPLIVAIVGLLMYVLASQAKVVEIGRIMFWTGLLVSLFVAAEKTLKL